MGAGQPTEISSSLPTDTKEDGGVQNLEFVLQQMHSTLMALTSYEANDIVANSRKESVRGMAEIAEAI